MSTTNKENIFNIIVQCLEKYSSTIQQLAYKGWHWVHSQEELLTGEGKEVGDGRAEGSSVVGDGGQAPISLMPDIGGPDPGSLLEPDACLNL